MQAHRLRAPATGNDQYYQRAENELVLRGHSQNSREHVRVSGREGVMTRTLSNTLASRNGRSIETCILRYMGLLHEKEPVDSSLEGSPLEIKSCQVLVGDRSHGNCKRSGRFAFDSEQHRYLLKNDGSYVFVVHDDQVVVHTKILRAELLPLREFRGIRSIAWPTVLGVGN